MADQPEKNPPSRSAADKERSRQQSRPVSGRDAKSSAQRPPQGGKQGGKSSGQAKGGGSRPGGKGASGPGRSPQGGKPRSSGGGSGRAGAPPVARRSPAPFIWGAVALVMVFVLVIVLVTVTGGNKTTPGADSQGGYPVTAAPASIVHQVTNIPASTFDAVGVSAGGQQVQPPTLVNKTSFDYNGKPGVFFFGAEYCPYCAAERWALIATLSRFGTFSNLEVTKSNAQDTDPSTPTFSFVNATYTSPYIGFKAVENENGDHTVITYPDKQEANILKEFNVTGYPFIDIANKYEENSPEYDPAILQGLTWSDIASNLHDPTNPITQTILASSNYMTAAICAANGGKPASVCDSPGVKAAAKALANGSG